jgi:hypothetical protein
MGIATALVERCTAELARQGILKTHVDVLQSNEVGQAYWESQGWKLRNDIRRYSYVRDGSVNA